MRAIIERRLNSMVATRKMVVYTGNVENIGKTIKTPTPLRVLTDTIIWCR